MSGVGLLDRVDGEELDGADGLLELVLGD